MIKNIVFLLIGAIITILIFNGIFAGVAKTKPSTSIEEPELEN